MTVHGLDQRYHSVALSSQRYDVVGVYASREESTTPASYPLMVNITIKMGPHPTDDRLSRSRGVNIKGELAREFTDELNKLRADLRGNEGTIQEWQVPSQPQAHRWNDTVIYPFIAMWVLKMDAIKDALKVMQVTRQGSKKTFSEWMDEQAKANVLTRQQYNTKSGVV